MRGNVCIKNVPTTLKIYVGKISGGGDKYRYLAVST